MKQAAVIMASFVYNTAMRDEKLPRKPAPAATGRGGRRARVRSVSLIPRQDDGIGARRGPFASPPRPSQRLRDSDFPGRRGTV